ncbi:hypothetical protein [Algivirga pacifica]|uniref:DUF2357 domain-containing protein n=1 Tax=Algivirga pacifica TaxID=1162670 RepID=A0ABP9D6A6_9BACT
MWTIKIFAIYKSSDPPFEISREELIPEESGDMVVVEHRFYEIELHYEEDESITRQELTIDGEPINPIYLSQHNEERYIKGSTMQYFSNRLGYVPIHFCGHEITVRVDASKLSGNEAEQILSYLYDKNKKLLLEYISGEGKRKGRESGVPSPLPLQEISINNLSPLSHFLDLMQDLYYDFEKLPYAIMRPKLVMEPYHAQAVDSKSIEWLMSNLDEVIFDDAYEQHPEAIEVDGYYGILEKIAYETNTPDFNTYENEIILGAIHKCRAIVNEISEHITSYLGSDRSMMESINANYQSIQIILFRKAFDELKTIKQKLSSVEEHYQQLFAGVYARTEIPKVTQVFSQKRHYTQAFTGIHHLYQLSLRLNKDSLINLNFLDQIYEVFNYYRLIDGLKVYFNNIPHDVEYSQQDGHLYKKVSFFGRRNGEDWVVNLLYNPKISRSPGDTHLVLHGKIDKKNNYYTPDYVLEYAQKHDIRYAIMDAKYKRSKVVVEQDIKDATLKYYTCLRVFGTKHHMKPDFLWLLCPDNMQYPIWRLNYNEDFLPIIGVVESKPDTLGPLQQVITNIIKRWGISKA